jgi:ATP-dependent RNA helicase DeaD
VLDEADEMLRMGFIDDVDAILAKTPSERRVALFSATMPPRIRQIAQRHLKDPIEIAVSAASSTNVNIEQFYWLAKGASKVEALKRLLAYEETDGVIVFTRTRESTSAVAEHLSQAGYRATALHGDMDQKARVRTVGQLKNGQLDVLVATDVAARGLDVDRITHVINFDIPFDEEAYVHRIGRTGRAGRNGKAILFVSPRERRMLRNIERLTKNSIPAMELPSLGAIALKQRELFAANLREQLTKAPQSHAEQLADTLASEHNGDYRGLAAQLLGLLAEQKGLALEPAKARKQETPFATATGAYPMTDSSEASSPPAKRKARPANRGSDDGTDKQPRKRSAEDSDKAQLGRALPLKNHPDILMERFRLAVGKRHGVEIREIVGAIANEAGIEGQYIGTVNIQQEFSTVDLPEGMPKEILQHLKKTRVKGNPLGIARI